MVTFKLNGWRVGDRDMRRRGLTPVKENLSVDFLEKKNLSVDNIFSDVPLVRYGLSLLDCKDDVFRQANPGFS